MMSDEKVSDTTLAWLWVIEYLASFHQINPSILHDLIEAAPDLPDDSGKNTREIVALRCLEGLLGYAIGLTNDVPFAPKQKVALDFSQSCEDVLHTILREMPVSDLKMIGPDLLKWDIQPFIVHKRVSMPKCALEQLRDAILEGTHPYAASLKELSGLVHTSNECDKTPAGYCDPNSLSTGINLGGINAQTVAPEVSSIPLPHEIDNGVVRDDLNDRNMLSLKRDRRDLANENLGGDYHENQVCMDDSDDVQSNSKRFKKDASFPNQSVEQISIPLHGKDLVEDSFKRIPGCAEKEDCHVEMESTLVGLKATSSLENGHDGGVHADGDSDSHHNECVLAYNKVPQDTSQDEMHEQKLANEADDAEHRVSNCAPTVETQCKTSIDKSKDNIGFVDQLNMSNFEPMSGLHRSKNVGEAKGGTDHLPEEDMSDSDDNGHERFDVAMKKSDFLNSQCSLSHDSLATADWTEQNLCVKCNKDGQLLACSVGGCPLVVHESCLGSSARFDASGDFYCPFCAYSLAITEYLEAKKKASLARKDLTAFMRLHAQHQPEDLASRLHSKRQSSLRQNGDGNLVDKTHGDENLIAADCDQANDGDHIYEANDHQFQKREGKEHLVEPLESDGDGGLIHISPGENERGEVVQECPSVGELNRQEDRVFSDPNYNDHNLFCKDKETFLVKKGLEEKNQKGVLDKRGTDSSEKPVCAINIDGGETSDDEEKSIMSNYSIRFRRGETKYTYPAIPQLRRKKVPWTAKEEEVLKEGVQKFSSVHNRSIPWKKILEYGTSVFQNNRTTMDLKDKWRNICKGSPKSQ